MEGVFLIGIGLGWFFGCLMGAALGRTEMLQQLGWTWAEFRMRVAYRKQFISKAAQAMKNPPAVHMSNQKGSAEGRVGMGLSKATPNRSKEG